MRDLCCAVGEILLDHWDPIGVAGEAAARDEYESYVPVVAGLVAAGASVDVLAARLLRIEQVDMGLRGDAARAQVVAAKLYRLAAR
ncbi:hypothetical protein [Xanthobacter oligotrophicus]|uniref:hypothetical protein n=1 Tax=Xanthobacter oligotrophicus TaxID=2607286 RepID=UPI0011F36487|nr:hypothetical protein [Xanthobacter oligotrophicus]MCG5234301.1 hypothetical protein [Xanthobacter oligotrophicus]